jgi:hypothetical protein
MARDYVKLHTCILDDPDINELPPTSGWIWTRMLALAGRREDGGRIGEVREIAYVLRVTADDVWQAVADLGGRVVERDGQLWFRDWGEWQPASSSERGRAFRQANAANETERDQTDRTPPNVRARAQPNHKPTRKQERTDTPLPTGVRQPSGRDGERSDTSPAGKPAGVSRGKREAKPTEPKPLWDAFCEAWHLPPGGGRHKGLAGEFDRDCIAAGASVEEFREFWSVCLADGSWGEYVQVHNTTTRFLAWRDRRGAEATMPVVRF